MKSGKIGEGYALKWAKKIKGINLLGGKCEYCGNDNIVVLTFHHTEKKDFNISQSMTLGWSLLEREIKKCTLLCSNCHSELHYVNSRGSKLKENLLEKCVQNIKCSRCGYRGKNFRSLCFHHRNPEDKKFSIGSAFARKINGGSVQDIVDEIAKCIILCRNCHEIEHFEKEKFKKMFKDIDNKVKNHKEKSLIDKKEVEKLKLEGMCIAEIAKKMGKNKSSIFYVFHRV